MHDPSLALTVAATGLAGLGMLLVAALAGWRGWLQLKHQELARTDRVGPALAQPSAGARIDIADLKERVRKLEAIAAGVEL